MFIPPQKEDQEAYEQVQKLTAILKKLDDKIDAKEGEEADPPPPLWMRLLVVLASGKNRLMGPTSFKQIQHVYRQLLMHLHTRRCRRIQNFFQLKNVWNSTKTLVSIPGAPGCAYPCRDWVVVRRGPIPHEGRGAGDSDGFSRSRDAVLREEHDGTTKRKQRNGGQAEVVGGRGRWGGGGRGGGVESVDVVTQGRYCFCFQQFQVRRRGQAGAAEEEVTSGMYNIVDCLAVWV